VLFGAGALFAPTTVLATPRGDITEDWIEALDQFAELELDSAKGTIDASIARAEGAGLANDPSLARLYVLKGGIEQSLNGDDGKTMEAFQRAVELDWNVELPIELQSDKLSQMLEQARGAVAKPGEGVIHTPPAIAKGGEVNISALANLKLAEEDQIALYHRKLGSDAEFQPVYLKRHGNMGEVVLPPESHGDVGLEYFFYVYDVNTKPLAGLGDQEHPLKVEASGEAAVGTGEGGTGEGGDDGGKKPKKPREKSKLPRVFINIGIGTGFGIARGAAELTYRQYRPGTIGGTYTIAEQACAIERWFVAGGDVASDQAEFGGHLAQIQAADPTILPGSATDLAAAYDPSYCAERHPVSTGLAPAPLHLTPEVGVRIGNRIVLSAFSRLQVVTGSKVFDADPTKEIPVSIQSDVRSPNPEGARVKPPFSWAIGAKFKYFFGKDDRKFRLFGGFFAGYGTTRLRVNMNFTNDRNGNSVPDADESALHGPQDLMGNIVPETCVAVWPYNNGCEVGTDGDPDRQLAATVNNGTNESENRIDTVKIGPGFVGGLFGFHYQIVKYFGVFAELDVGGWFPSTSSVLFDINVGPSITF
jgi:hypothetical protein